LSGCFDRLSTGILQGRFFIDESQDSVFEKTVFPSFFVYNKIVFLVIFNERRFP